MHPAASVSSPLFFYGSVSLWLSSSCGCPRIASSTQLLCRARNFLDARSASWAIASASSAIHKNPQRKRLIGEEASSRVTRPYDMNPAFKTNDRVHHEVLPEWTSRTELF